MDNFDAWLRNEPLPEEEYEEVGDCEPYDYLEDEKME